MSSLAHTLKLVEINISADCPKLAKLLLALRPHVATLQQSETLYVFCMGDGSQMTPGCFSQRLPGIWKRLQLSFTVPAGMTGLNGELQGYTSTSLARGGTRF
jgi:hypothetical protein